MHECGYTVVAEKLNARGHGAPHTVRSGDFGWQADMQLSVPGGAFSQKKQVLVKNNPPPKN